MELDKLISLFGFAKTFLVGRGKNTSIHQALDFFGFIAGFLRKKLSWMVTENMFVTSETPRCGNPSAYYTQL